MAILEQDIQILESQVLADVPEGGGAATGNEVVDGESNNLFPDVSELDRVHGAVNLRKVFVAVRTPDTDGYYGAHVIVSKPPEDPDVSCVLFKTGDDFDRREAAANRIESYLAPGPEYGGLLFGNHIAGQMSVSIIQRIEQAPPVVGSTLVLRKNEGLTSAFEQFVRFTSVTASERTFTDDQGDFVRKEVVCGISDELGQDFNGFNPSRYDTAINYTNKTRLLETIVADAARYYGVKPLDETAAMGDFVVKADGIFEQLVPSGRSETSIADARMNQQSATLVKAGETFTRNLTMSFTTTQGMFVGGQVLPGSLSVSRGGVTITDRGGELIDGTGAAIGTVDYSNGVLELATNVFGPSAGTHTVSYQPASNPVIVGESLSIPVEEASQRRTYTLSLVPPPARGTLQVDYRALGNWYSLRDDGSGALRGGDSSAGAGTLNPSTGTVSVTLGALPDVDSSIILTYAPAVVSRPIDDVPPGVPGAERVFGKAVDIGSAIKPGTLSFTWNDGTPRTATDSGGVLTGDASGTVNYGEGVVHFCPDLLPAAGTTITIAVTEAAQVKTVVPTFTDSGANWTCNLSAPLKAKTVDLSIVGRYDNDPPVYRSVRLIDDGLGALLLVNPDGNVAVGTVNYSTGAISIPKSIPTFKYEGAYTVWAPSGASIWGGGSFGTRLYGVITRTLTVLNGPGANTVPSPPWAWWSGNQANALEARYSGSDGSGSTYAFDFDEIFMPASLGGFTDSPGQRMDVVSLQLGAEFYRRNLGDGNWTREPSPTTGTGTNAGAEAILGGVKGVLLTSWPTGVSSTPTFIAGATSGDVSGIHSLMTVTKASFRTAVAPLVNSGFNVAGNWARDGSAFSEVADLDGIISSGSAPVGSTPGSYGVFGRVNYEMGVVELLFGRRVPSSMAGADFVVDMSTSGIPGLGYVEVSAVQADTLRYNADAYTYLPLDPDILGLESVRLPVDGRVPIFRTGSVAVVHHTAQMSPATVSNGQTLNTGRTRLSRLRVIGADGVPITAGYSTNLDAGTVTFSNVSGYSQPVSVEHRVEDAAMVAAAQINGTLRLSRALTHNYPMGSYVSSALVIGNMFARVPLLFDQATWNISSPVWSDDLSGSTAGAAFDTINYPPVVTNRSAVTERWALVFTGTTNFSIYGEHLGLVGTGNTASDCRPLNPETGEPYFHLDFEGFGGGWAVGNAIRINTVGALFPVWWARVIKQGVATTTSDSATILVRGDIDTP